MTYTSNLVIEMTSYLQVLPRHSTWYDDECPTVKAPTRQIRDAQTES